MLVFINEKNKEVYKVPSVDNRKINLLLKFSPKTTRFLKSFYELQIQTFEVQGQALEMSKLDIENMNNDEFKIIVEINKEVAGAAKNKMDIQIELLELLDLNKEYEDGVFNANDIDQIYDLVTARYPSSQNQNLPPAGIEKKTLKGKQLDTNQ